MELLVDAEEALASEITVLPTCDRCTSLGTLKRLLARLENDDHDVSLPRNYDETLLVETYGTESLDVEERRAA